MSLHDLLSNPILVLLSTGEGFGVIYYLILLPPLYWGHNATFTVENATYGPTAGKIGNIDHRREIYLYSTNMRGISKFTLPILSQSIVVIGASYVLPAEYCGILQ